MFSIKWIKRTALIMALIMLSIVAPSTKDYFYDTGAPGALLYDIIIPASPFLLLCVLAIARSNGRFLFSNASITGSALGAILAIALPRVLLWYDSAHYDGGGANIGIGILLMCLPVYLIIAMLVGGWLGRLLGSHRHNAAKA